MIMGGQSATGDLLSYMISSHPATSKLVLPKKGSIFDAVQEVLDDIVKRRELGSAVELAKDAFLYPDFRGKLLKC
jgi:ribulose kinase